MPLFEIQDADRPMFVIEKDYQAAVDRWNEVVGDENDLTPSEVEPPLGVRIVADNDNLIIGKSTLNSPLANETPVSINFFRPGSR